MENKTICIPPNITALNRETYKYCIKSMYENLNSETKQVIIGKLLQSKIARTTFSDYCNIKMESQKDIPAQRLDIIAAILGVKASYLKNYTIQKKEDFVHPIYQSNKK